MDTFKLILFFVLSLQSGFVLSQSVFDMGEHSGIIRDSTGNYSQVSANGSIRSLTSNTALALVEKPIIQTSKGAVEVTLNCAASVDLARMGSAVAGVAKAFGPIGMTLTAVSLICELTSICNQAGHWMMSGSTDPSFPASYPVSDGQWWGWGDTWYPSVTAACKDSLRLSQNIGEGATYLRNEQLNEGTYQCFGTLPQFPGSEYSASNTTRASGCSPGYTLSGSLCQKDSLTSTAPTDSDWAAKESLLNDARFTPELHTGGYPIPTGTPTLTGSPVTVPLGSSTKTLKDGAGNTTGSEVTTDSLSITDGATSENPNGINLTQTTITNNYNTSNVLTSSSTTVTDPQQPKTDGIEIEIEIEIDNMQDQPLEQQAIPGLFTHTSWGSGSCPGDRSVSYHYGTLNLSFQPACDAAIALQPLVVILAGITALFIISGAVRND